MSTRKWEKCMKRKFTEGNIQMANKYTNSCINTSRHRIANKNESLEVGKN